MMIMAIKTIIWIGLSLVLAGAEELLTPGNPVVSFGRSPTASPIISSPSVAGWIYSTSYIGGTSDSDIQVYTGMATEMCFGLGLGSQMYSCNAGSELLTHTRWHSKDCSGASYFSRTVAFSEIGLDDDNINTDDSNSVVWRCSTSTTIPTADGITFGVFMRWMDEPTCSGQPLIFSAAVENKCVAVNGSSVKFVLPTFTCYNGTTCSGTPTKTITVQSDSCIDRSDDENYYDDDIFTVHSAVAETDLPDDLLQSLSKHLKQNIGDPRFLSNAMSPSRFDDDNLRSITYEWLSITNGNPTVRPSARPTFRATNAPTYAAGAPTPLPTFQPSTAAPSVAQTYQFPVIQRLQNVSASAFRADLVTNAEALASAVAQCMTDIKSSAIHIVNITEDVVTSGHIRHLTTGSATTSCKVGYTVQYDLAALGYYNNPGGAYNSLTTQLQRNVDNDNFNQYLQSQASSVSASALAHASSNSLNTSSYAVVTIVPSMAPTSAANRNNSGSSSSTSGTLNKHSKFSKNSLILAAVLGGIALLCVCGMTIVRLLSLGSHPYEGPPVDVAGITAANRARLHLELAEGQYRELHPMYSSIQSQQQQMLQQTPHLSGGAVDHHHTADASNHRYGHVNDMTRPHY